MAAGDLAAPVTTAVTGMAPEFTLVAAAGLTIGVLTYGTKRLWGFFKGISK